jgi:hypothetical protein
MNGIVYRASGATLHGKTKKIIIFITKLHSKRQDCGASVASAAGPLATKEMYEVLVE